MKGKTKRVILIILGILVLMVLAVVLYFYMAFSGNPIERFQERRAVVEFYESRYEEDFEVLRSSYDYKRGEFSFRLAPKNRDNLVFTTTLGETRSVDRYGQLQATNYLETVIRESLEENPGDIDYQLYVYEEYTSPGILETDLQQRLRLNSYTVSIAWDTETIEEKEVDAFLETTAEHTMEILDISVGRIRFRANVFDGEDYYFSDVVVEK